MFVLEIHVGLKLVKQVIMLTGKFQELNLIKSLL